MSGLVDRKPKPIKFGLIWENVAQKNSEWRYFSHRVSGANSVQTNLRVMMSQCKDSVTLVKHRYSMSTALSMSTIFRK